MCLRNVKGPFLAHKDIEVVKYLRTRACWDSDTQTYVDGLAGPWQGLRYRPGILNSVDKTSYDWKETAASISLGGIAHGGLHSYQQIVQKHEGPDWTYEERRRNDLHLQLQESYGAKPYRAIIPQGATFYTGKCEWEQPAYISDQLKLVNDIPLLEVTP